jgi:hypothetical protein
LAAAFDSSNSFANKFSALQKSNAQAVRPQLDSFRKVTQPPLPYSGFHRNDELQMNWEAVRIVIFLVAAGGTANQNETG